MSLGSAKEVENLLGRLGNLITCDQDSDLCSAKDLIIDVSELLSTESKSIHYDLCLSLTLGDNGLLHFCRQTVTKNQFGDAKKSALEIIKALLEKQTSKLLNHAKEILLVSQQLYRVDVAAKVRIAALELLGALLLKAPPDVISQHLDLNSLITSLCVSIKSAKVPSVVHHELELLGLLTFALPGETQGQASFLLKVLCDQLNRHTGKRPDLTILAGSVRGLTYYLHHFPHGAEDVPELYKDLYGRLHKIIDPNLQLPKREAPRVTLELLHQHAAKFSHELLVRHRTLFPWLLRWSCAYNRDDLKAGRRAMDSFLAVVASELELNPSKLSHDAFCYLVGEFSRLLESGVHPGETSKNSLPGVSSTSYCVSLAVRGYGLFAGACKQLLAPEQLVVLFSTVLTASQHAFYQSSELLDTKLASLPTFVRALAAILKQMPEVEWPSVNGVLELSVALVRNYPDLGAAQRAHAHTAILALLVAATSTSRLSCILHLWVHQSILVTCSHDTETADEGTAAKNIPAEAGGHWRGVADEPTSYKSYLPLWSVLLSAQRASRITLPEVPVSRRSSVCCSIFSEFFSAATTIIAQLDLSTRPQQQQQQQQLQTADALASEYNQLHTSSIDELVANTPKDIQVYDSLMALVADVLVVCCPQMKDSEADAIFEVQHDASSVAPADAEHDNFSSVSDESERFAKSARMSEAQATEEAGDERDCEAVVALSLSLVSRAIREPCVAQHYTLLGALLRFLAAHRSSALNDDSGASADLLELVVSFACDSCEASRHFSDHLLASCLSFLLQLPPLFLHQLVSHLHQPLSTALELGLSYAPVGLSAVACLQRLVNELPASQDENFKAVVRQLVQNSLPALLAYVQNPQREGSELQSRVVSVKLSLLNQHRRVDLRKLKQSTLGSVNSVRDVEQRVLKLLGSVGGDLWKSMATDESVVLRWDDRDHVAFKVPYQHTTLDLHLDRVVPHVAHLALHSSNRQTKVAASEMLHSIIIILIGSGRTSTRPSAPLYRHLFSTCLRLSCDADHVSRHLFVTLVMQCTHYFTCNREYEHPDTMALLHAIMEGLESSSNPALRDFSARCLLEFLVWSRKQTVQVSSSKTSSRLTVPESVHPNLKSVMKRIVNLLRHPSACKRIGGCVALNSVYTEVRESEVAVDVWLLELFAAVVACLSLAEVDHAAQPTATLGSTALRRLCRIATHYSAMFNEPSQRRRVPESLQGKPGTLAGLAEWLLGVCGHRASPVRRAVMAVLPDLAPGVHDCHNLQQLVEQHVRSTEQQQWFVSVVLERGGHKSYEALIEPGRSTPVPAQPQRWALFLKHVLACVEAHLWLIGQRLVLATLLLSHSSSHVVDVLHHFVLHVGPGLRHPRTCVPGSLIHTQCTLIVRLMDFVTVVLAESKEASLTLLTQLLCPEFFEVLAAAVLEPLSLGFNLRDTEVFQKLLPRLTELLKAAGRSLNEPQKQLFVKAVDRIMASDQRLLPALLPLDATHLTVPIHTRHYLQGVAVLHETRWLEHAAGDTAKVSLARHITLWARHLLTPPPSAVLRAEASPHLLQFCSDALHIALRLREETVAEMIELLSGSGNQDGDAVHQDIVMKVLVQRSSFCVGRCAELSRAGCVRPAVRLLLALARVLMKESSLRNRYSKELVENAVSVWTTFLASSGGTSSGGEASWSAVSGKGDLVALMALLMLIDQDQIIATHCNAAHPAAGAAAHPATGAAAPASCAIFDFWLHIISDDKTELHLKLTCMQLLPFFCTMVDGVQLKVVEALEYFSVHHLPLKSTEYPVGSARDRDLRRCLTLLLTALELSASLPLLMHIVQLFCREPQHRYQHLLEKSIEKMSSGMSTDAQLAAVIRVYDKIESQLAMGLQQNRLLLSKLVLLPLLRSAQVVCVERFYVRYLVHIMGYLTGPLTSRSDMQQVALTSKLVALRVMQLMYAKLSRDQCFSSASAVNASFSPQDTSGKALTKEVMKCAVRLAKGELRHDKTNHELRRECASAAYCLLISLLVNVQNDLKFYTNFLFIQNKEKGEALWASMIDTDHQWDFGVEMNVEGGRKSHLVAVRQAANFEASKTGPEGHHQPTVLMFESRYLSNCSLSQDLSQYDFSSALVLSFGEKKKQGQIREDDNGTLVPVTLETCDYNKHEVMPELTAALLHMKTLENQRSPLPPAWMTELLREISSSSTARNVRLFLLRLMTNTSQIFAAHAREVSRAVLCCINDGTAGRGCNYFVADLVVMLVGWGEAGAPTDPADQPMTIELLRRLVVSLPHLRADVFRYNVDLLRGLVAVWRTAWGVVDGSAIAELLETQDGENREVEAGLHAAACLLVSNVAPCDETNSLQVSRLRKALLRSMRSPRAAVYNAAAEVIGLILSRAAAKGGSASDSSTASLPRACAELADEVTPCIMELITKQQAQGLSALFHIHKHFPAIANRFASKLLVLLPMLYGLQKMRALECLIMPLSAMPNCFQHLSQQRITDVLLTREPASQLVLLRLLNSCFTTLSAEESLHFLPSLLGFLKHPVSSCREVLYSSLTFLHDRYRDGSSSHQKEIWNLAHDALLRAVADEDTQLRQFILDYWTQSAISLTAQELLLYILRDLYSVGSEHTFLHTACHVLLQLTHSSPSYSRTLFEHPLTECKFWEMRVCPAWQARHASMVNLFSNTQGSAEANGAPSVSQLVALTQGGEEVGHVLGVVAATQHKQFTQTQAAPTESMSSTFNFGPGATIREDVSLTELQDKTNTVSQGPAGLVFSLAPNSKQSYSKTGLGITRLKPKIFGDEDNKDGSASVVASTLIRRRFQRQQDREKQARYFAEAEEKRRLLQMRLEREKKLRREAQVTMIREYRVGELPDIQIKQQAVIDPLQALTERDSIVAEHMFVILIEGLMQHGENWLSNEEFEQWREQVRVALCSLLSDSVQHSPKVMASVLHLLLSFKMTFPPDTVTNVCLSSGQEPLGVLLLEQQILSMQKQLRLSPPKKKQKRCIVGETTNCSETDIFKVQLHLAELYSSLSMWDAVRGVLQSGSSLHASTAEALLYESLDQPLQAYELYLAALAAPDMQHTVEEQKVWEDRVCSTASELGMWGVLDSFVDRRLIRDPATEKADPERLWQLSRPSTTISVFLNARLVKLFEGSHSDGGLVQFVNNAMKEESRKLLLENNVGLQLAVLSVNQEKLHLARSFLSAATDALLAKLGHQSLAFSKPLTSSLRELQLLMELEQFLNVHENSMKEKNELILRLCSQWMKNLPTSSDNIVFTQFLVFYRDVYFHFLKKKTTGCVWKKIHETKVTSHIAVTEIALGTNNTLLASQHLFKLDALLQMGRLSENLAVKYHFLRTQNSICRGRQKSGAERIKLLVNAWCKQLGNVNKLQSSSHSPTIDMEYLCFESKLCVELCHAIESLDGDLDSAKSHLDLVAQKFPIVREDPRSWYRNLLQCGFSALTQACDLRSKQISDKELTDSTKIDTCKSYETLAVYCEDCINSWPGSIDMTEYRKTLVSSTLKAMSSGSRVAHFNFPRLIHLMEAHSGLLEVFEREVASVPLWMFLLWLPHILIYLEKIPGQVLRPIVVQLAEEYPQAVFYPFSVSKTCYKFDGEMGPAVRAMCYKIEEIMDTKCGLLQPFLNAITLVREPFGVLKQELMSVRSATSSQTKVTKLRAIHEQLFKANSPLSGKITSLKNPSLQSTGSQLGGQYNLIFEKLKGIFKKFFGETASKIQVSKLKDLDICITSLLSCWSKSLTDVKGVSPWLSNFQGSHYSEKIEVPGLYTGFSKPCVDYHPSILNFDNDLHVFTSLRRPAVIKMHADDEKTYQFLIKSGEDLRTDQRIEQMFALMNNIFANSSVTKRLSAEPKVSTFNVVPLTPELGMLQWVDGTTTLKVFMESSLADQEKETYEISLKRFSSAKSNLQLLNTKKTECVEAYLKCVNSLPWDLLRRSLMNLSTSYDNFFLLRTKFCSSHAVFSIAQWLLGIGDRHLSNFLVEFKTAKIVGIDFDHHFETATQFLSHPELMPFRMSPQIVNVAQPLSTKGIIRESMVSCMQALVSHKRVILAAVEAFVKEPTQGWLRFVQRQEGTVSEKGIELYSAKRMEFISEKLSGINPCQIIDWAVRHNTSLDSATKSFLSTVVQGKDEKRESSKKTGLSVPEQVDTLLELAMDPNILGRTYPGWSPCT